MVKQSTVGDIALSFYESMFGFIPIFIMEKLIKNHRPREQKIEEFEKKLEIREQLKLKQKLYHRGVTSNASNITPRSLSMNNRSNLNKQLSMVASTDNSRKPSIANEFEDETNNTDAVTFNLC